MYLAQYGGSWRSARVKQVVSAQFEATRESQTLVIFGHNGANEGEEKLLRKYAGNSPSGSGGLRILTTDKDSALILPVCTRLYEEECFSALRQVGKSTSSDVYCLHLHPANVNLTRRKHVKLSLVVSAFQRLSSLSSRSPSSHV